MARILRWDRSGIVTEAFRYNEEGFLVEFFHHYSKASPVMCGSDGTTSLPTDLKARAAREALKLDAGTPLVKLSIPASDAARARYFVVASPSAILYTPPGRATRGFKAYDILN
jgi:hypothetical protein